MYIIVYPFLIFKITLMVLTSMETASFYFLENMNVLKVINTFYILL